MVVSEPSLAMLQGSDLPRISATFNFARDLPIMHMKGHTRSLGALPPEQEQMRTNVSYEVYTVLASDLRQASKSLSLEENGIEYLWNQNLSKKTLGQEKG